MKGISTVIATLLMLVITVGLAITAYGYITGLFSAQTERLIELADASCVAGGNYFAVVRNLDPFNNVTVNSVIIAIDDTPIGSTDISWGGATFISANGGTEVATIQNQNPQAGTVHRVKVTGPSGRPQQLTVSC